MNKKQKFHRYDLVRIAKNLSKDNMSHFTSDRNAIVLGSYADEFPHWSGLDSHKEYDLYVEGEGETAWYLEKQLTLIKKNQQKLLEKWRKIRS